MLTHGAIALDGEDVTDLGGAAAWGLTRSAQSENPGRIVLIDVDSAEASYRLLPSAVASGEPQMALRDGELSIPRLVRAPSRPRARPSTGPAVC
ncbi:hypothetical protein NKH77_05740 [Streptomyces sp. M19]